MENIDPSDTMIPACKIKAFNETVLDQLIDSRNTNHKSLADFEISHVIVMSAHAHKFGFALGIYIHDFAMNSHELAHPYAIFHALYVVVYNIHLHIANILHHLNKSRRAG